jgi:phosphatidylinositol alpha-1,6-mannosyltransferase
MRPCLAAITLDPRGGGIATVSRLLWRFLQDEWPGDASLITLLRSAPGLTTLHPNGPQRLVFGGRLAVAQATKRCDWLLFSHLALAQAQRFVPAGLRRPYAVFLHDVEAWDPMPAVRSAALAGAALRIANSRFTAERVMSAHPDVGEVMPCPLALLPAVEPYDAGASQARFGSHAVIVVGRMNASERYKGHDQLLQAWPAVLKRVPDAQLIVVGDGDDVPRLKAEAGALGIETGVSFPGFVSETELNALYRDAALFAMPSRREGFGLVYLEAMSRGLPCIGSVHDASGEVIEDGLTGVLVDQADIPSLAARIAELLEDPVSRQAFGEAGRRRVQAHFTYERFAERLKGLIAARGPEAASGAVRQRPSVG